MLTADDLRRLLDYDPATGVFTWRQRPELRHFDVAWNKKYAGKRAGRSKPNFRGYHEIAIGSRLFLSHRLAWLYMTGEWPADQIDHENLNKSDNRWDNLREATPAQNGWNTRVLKRNKTGVKGVSWSRQNKCYMAFMVIGGKNTYLGGSPTIEGAASIYAEAAAKHRGDFARC